MKVLIDTHIFLWLLFSPEKITKAKRNVLAEAENDVYISSVSFWEISLKYALGKLDLTGVKPEQLPSLAEQMGISCLALSHQQAASFHQLPKRNHKDPFDRMIVWQAMQGNLQLLSNDSSFTDYEDSGLNLM